MPGLQDIAGEIKVLIAESLLPQDCFHFAFTDKHTWLLCKPLIERHRRLSKEYGIVVAKFGKYTVWDTLDAVLADPRLAFYITEARLLADHCSILNNPFLNAELAPNSVRCPMAFETWQQSTIECEHEWMGNSLVRIADAYQGSNPEPGLPFDHLQELYLAHWNAGPFQHDLALSWQWLNSALRIPSLRKLVGVMVSEPNMEIFPTTVPDDGPKLDDCATIPTSNVTTLVLANSGIDFTSLRVMLSNIKSLKTFKYEYGSHGLNLLADWDPEGIIRELALIYPEHETVAITYCPQHWNTSTLLGGLQRTIATLTSAVGRSTERWPVKSLG